MLRPTSRLLWPLSRPAGAAGDHRSRGSPDELRASAAVFDVSLDAAQLEALDEIGRSVPGMLVEETVDSHDDGLPLPSRLRDADRSAGIVR